MSVSRSLSLLAVALGACATPARADEATTDVDISRVTLKLPGDGWTISDKLPYAVSVESSPVSVDGERRLILRGTSESKTRVVMLVSATRGHGGVTEHAECEPEDGAYVRKFNRGQSTYIPLQCLRVFGPARFPADPQEFGGPLGEVMAARKIAGPPGGFYVNVEVCNENGAVVQIRAMISTGFAGLPGKSAASRLPQGMREAVAAWADALAESALGTLSAWNAQLVVPPVAFIQAAPTTVSASASAAVPSTKD